ncbi:Aldo/keto reductase [Brucella ceti TE10759-12]|nr:Aldo/keto reductase [Brucella ceti TE10759-12]
MDLYLIHWPMPSKDLFMETWRAFIKLKEEGRVKSIGVSNFRTADLERLIKESGVTPVLNQIELHPQFQQDELRLFHGKHDIATEAWSPLGQGKLLEDPTLKSIAEKHAKSVAQIILRWHIETGNIVIPKSITPARIKENFDIFDFTLNGTDHDGTDHETRSSCTPSSSRMNCACSMASTTSQRKPGARSARANFWKTRR